MNKKIETIILYFEVVKKVIYYWL